MCKTEYIESIEIKLLPEKEAATIQQSQLSEIFDSSLLNKINVPGLMQIVAAVGANTSDVCRINIPYDKLSKVSGDVTKARAYVVGPDGKIIEQAKLEKVSCKLTNVAAIMEVASMIVGQYYMAQIDKSLKDMNKKLEKLIAFQENERKGKMLSIMQSIHGKIHNQTEILKNDELRKLELLSLDQDGKKCSELLMQSFCSVDTILKDNDLEYEEYEKKVQEIERELLYQQYLLRILCEIANLKYTFLFGTVSKEYCYNGLDLLASKFNTQQEQIPKWHKKCVKKFNIICIDNSKKELGRLKAPGIAKKLMYTICPYLRSWPSYPITITPIMLLKDKAEPIPKAISQAIITQAIPTKAEIISNYDRRELYMENITLIVKEGRTYYMPASL